MRVHCVCVVRDEADILPFTLESALKWAHAIYVLDNGSTDGTWELLERYARRYSQVVLAGRNDGLFRNAMRGEVVNMVSHDAREGDWWCRLDADELYVSDPRTTLQRVPSRFALAYGLSIEYCFTELDLAAYEEDPEAYVRLWTPGRMRYYCACWSEIRFVRHLADIPWDGAWPVGVKQLRGAPERILLKHYQFRNPPQIARRLHARRYRTEEGSFRHEKNERHSSVHPLSPDHVFSDAYMPDQPLWKQRIYRSDLLKHDRGDGTYHIDWDALPPVQRGRTLASRFRDLSRRLRRGFGPP